MAPTTWAFPTWNHPAVSKETLRDWHLPMQRALSAMGHRLVQEWQPADVTLYTEYFTLEDVARMRAGPRPYGILCTEWIEVDRLVGRPKRRQLAFMEAIKDAAFLWAAVDVESYAALGRPTAHVEVAWEPDHYRRADVQPKVDLCYYGSVTPERQEMVARVSQRASVMVVPFGSTMEQRDAAIAKARYVLAMPAKCGKPSSTRISAAMHADRPVLPPSEAMHMELSRDRWDEERRVQLADYQAQPSMREILSAAIAGTVGRRG